MKNLLLALLLSCASISMLAEVEEAPVADRTELPAEETPATVPAPAPVEEAPAA